MSIEGPTKRITVEGEENAAMVSLFLITRRSAAFELTPLPDDQWRFTVKDEGHVDAMVQQLGLFPHKMLPLPEVMELAELG
jgi:hypothetical protein